MAHVSLYLCVGFLFLPSGCLGSIVQNKFAVDAFRLATVAFDSLFYNSDVTKSRIRCLASCILIGANTYYDENSKRCSCQSACYTGAAVASGGNNVLQYTTIGTYK